MIKALRSRPSALVKAGARCLGGFGANGSPRGSYPLRSTLETSLNALRLSISLCEATNATIEVSPLG